MHRAIAWIFVLGSVGVATALLQPASSSALSCNVGLSAKNSQEFFLGADGAITGKVVSVRSRETSQGEGVSSRERVTVYRIGRSFKKKRRLTPGTRVRVFGPVEQKEGSRGGILLDRRDGEWTGSGCSQIDRSLLRRTARKLDRV